MMRAAVAETGSRWERSATKSANPSTSQIGAVLVAASVATWVASWVITTWAPCGWSGRKTRGLTYTWLGGGGELEPSTVVVTAAIPRYWSRRASSTDCSSLSEAAISTTRPPGQLGRTPRTW